MSYAERRFAQAYAAKHQLVPPIDVAAEVRRHADIENDDLPGSADALVLRKAGERPLVLLSRNLNTNRERFTLAHELGHLVLPWQVGSAFCHADITVVAGEGLHDEIEREANNFATELLVPTAWIGSVLPSLSGTLAAKLLELANVAGVSPITAAIALERTDCVRAAVAVMGVGVPRPYASWTSTCPLTRATQWWHDVDAVRQAGGALSEVSFGRYKLVAAEFVGDLGRTIARPQDESKLILREIVDMLPEQERHSIVCKVNGVVSAANPKKREAPALFYELMRGAFVGRVHLRDVVAHPRFDDFLRAKAVELSERWRGR